MKRNRIVVEVDGGIVQNIYANCNIEVEVVDWDNASWSEEDCRQCKLILDEAINDKAYKHVY